MTRGILHPKDGQAYHLVNSIRGLRRGRHEGYRRADRDLSITKDGVIVVNHWPRLMEKDGFRDPLGLIPRSTPIQALTWDQVKRLRTFPGLYRVNTLRRDLEECARLDMEAVLEPKGDPRFLLPDTWVQIRHLVEETGAKASGYVLNHNNPTGTVVRLARTYGGLDGFHEIR